MRLINEDAVMEIIERVTNEAVEKKQPKYLIQLRIIAEISGLPTIEAEPVVRCKDCKYRQDSDFCGGRGWPAQLVPDDGYCDRGARMDGESDA